MSFTSSQAAAQRGGRRPAALADSQLRHLENMVEYVARRGATPADEFHHGYWEQRIRVLEDTHELLACQRHRIARLRHRLSAEAEATDRMQ